MGRLPADVLDRLDHRLAGTDAALAAAAARAATAAAVRQPVHTVYVPADAVAPGLVADWGRRALAAVRVNPPAPYPEALAPRVEAKLAAEPIEDLRVDFEDGYGDRGDAAEDAAARAAVVALLADPLPPVVGVRCKSLEPATRRRAARTLDVVLSAWLDAAPLPDGFVVTLPKVSAVAQVEAMVELCAALETAYGLPAGRLRFEIQVETPAAVLGADGTATVARMIGAAAGRCAGLHYGTYDYSAALGVAAAYQAMDHPVADHAKAVMQVAGATGGVPVSDGSTNVLPVGDPDAVHAAWRRHAALVRRSLERGIYQGWDLHPAQLPTRFGATYAFFRDGLPAARSRLSAYLTRRADACAAGTSVAEASVAGTSPGILDEPATARALTDFLRRGLACGALDPAEVPEWAAAHG